MPQQTWQKEGSIRLFTVIVHSPNQDIPVTEKAVTGIFLSLRMKRKEVSSFYFLLIFIFSHLNKTKYFRIHLSYEVIKEKAKRDLSQKDKDSEQTTDRQTEIATP